MPTGRLEKPLKLRFSNVNALSLPKIPAGKVASRLLDNSRVSSAPSPSKTPAGNVASALACNASVLSVPRPSKMSAGNVASVPLLRSRVSSAVSPAKSPLCSVARPASDRSRLVTPLRWAGVMAEQFDTPASVTRASRTAGVRTQTEV